MFLKNLKAADDLEMSKNGQATPVIKLFNKALSKDTSNLDAYYQKLNKRFNSCCKCLANLLLNSDEIVVKIRLNQLIKFIRRLFYFDLKKLVCNEIEF